MKAQVFLADSLGLWNCKMLASVIPCVCALETWLALKFLSWELRCSQEKNREDGPMWLSQLLINTPQNYRRGIFCSLHPAVSLDIRHRKNRSLDLAIFIFLNAVCTYDRDLAGMHKTALWQGVRRYSTYNSISSMINFRGVQVTLYILRKWSTSAWQIKGSSHSLFQASYSGVTRSI